MSKLTISTLTISHHNISNLKIQSNIDFIETLPIFLDERAGEDLLKTKESFLNILNAVVNLKRSQDNVFTIGGFISFEQFLELISDWFVTIKNKYADNSLKALNYDLIKYFKSCKNLGINPISLSKKELVTILEISFQTDKPATINRYCSSISIFFKALDLPNHAASDYVSSFIKKTAKAKSSLQAQAEPLFLHHLDQLCEQWRYSEKLADQRDLIILSFMFECCMRRKEIISIEIKHLIFDDKQNKLFIPKSKSDQLGKGAIIPFSARTANIIKNWLKTTGLTDGYLLRPLSNVGRVKNTHTLLDIATINRTAARASNFFELEKNFSGHSGRVGAIQTMVKNKASTPEILLNSRLSSEKMVVRYSRKLNADELPMAQLLSNRK